MRLKKSSRFLSGVLALVTALWDLLSERYLPYLKVAHPGPGMLPQAPGARLRQYIRGLTKVPYSSTLASSMAYLPCRSMKKLRWIKTLACQVSPQPSIVAPLHGPIEISSSHRCRARLAETHPSVITLLASQEVSTILSPMSHLIGSDAQ